MGIFGVNMPLLYREGEGAFNRLQEEIMKVSDDHGLVAWKRPASSFNSLLASYPAAFSTCSKINPLDSYSTLSGPLSVNNKGIHLRLRLLSLEQNQENRYLAILPRVVKGEFSKRVGIYVEAASESEEYFTRTNPRDFQLVNIRESTLLSCTEKLLCFQRPRQISERQLPLVRASERGNETLVRFLLGKKAANLGLQHKIDWKLVFKAVENGHEAVVKLEKGANPKSKSDYGYTLLAVAAGNGIRQWQSYCLRRVLIPSREVNVAGLRSHLLQEMGMRQW
jgi:hypothetical protein